MKETAPRASKRIGAALVVAGLLISVILTSALVSFSSAPIARAACFEQMDDSGQTHWYSSDGKGYLNKADCENSEHGFSTSVGGGGGEGELDYKSFWRECRKVVDLAWVVCPIIWGVSSLVDGLNKLIADFF